MKSLSKMAWLLLTVSVAHPSIVRAQGVADNPSDRVAKTIEEVIVTGTQIKGANIAGALPVTVISKEDLDAAGATTGDELLRSIPQIGATGFTETRGGTTGVNAARGDAASFNLRSIGEGNTLVLINGRRMVLHPITQTSSVDGVPVTSSNANTLPVSGLRKVEVLRDGAGALYGADAVAGVINYILDNGYEGGRINLRFGSESGTDRRAVRISGGKRFQFNDGQANLVLSGSYSKRDGIMASAKPYSSNQDLRSLLPRFSRDIALDNRSSLEAYALVRYNGLGTFHVRPAVLTRDNGSQWDESDCGGRGLAGSATVYDSDGQDLCLDASSQDRAIRPNRNEHRTLVSDLERLNIFSFFNTQLTNTLEAYGEISYYRSVTERQWEQASILSNGRFYVPATAYYNPFGPAMLTDGSTNPNRLPNLDTSIVPEAGLGFEVLSLRPTDVGPRMIKIIGNSYRLLGGLRGNWGGWDYDTAIVYSKATVKDEARNRISTPLFQTQIGLSTPDAYNIFSGVNPDNPASIMDATPNPRSSIDPFITSSARRATTQLTLLDFRLSNASLFNMPSGPAALGLGLEWRKETLDENNSSIFDGSTPFIDALDPNLAQGEITNKSSLQGSSVRPDVVANRTVASFYAELLMPLLSNLPGINSLDVQLAGRYEKFDEVGGIARPKVALSWYPTNWLQVRSAYSKGFRAPNLIQLNSPATSITTAVADFSEGIHLDTGSLNTGPANGNYILETSGNKDLDSEKSTNASLGIVFTPLDNFTITVDWWQIKTTGTVGVFSDENESRLDAVLRMQGSVNPRITRDAPDNENPLGQILMIQRRYENLNERAVAGIDIGVFYTIEPAIGRLKFQVNTAKLNKFDQEPGGNASLLVNAGANPTVLGSSVGSLIQREFFPKWRATAKVDWRSPNKNWGAAVFVRFVDKVFEPRVTDRNDEFYYLDSHTTVNLSFVRRNLFGDKSLLRIGINNVFDQDPPLASESYGYEGELHSSRAQYVYASISKSFN